MRDIELEQRMEKFIPASKPVRHVELRVALKKLREAVGESQILENA